MATDAAEKLIQESESELERAVRLTALPDDASGGLVRLLWAFDARRRSRETLAIRESAQALAKRH